jgi:surface antigen
VIFFCYQKSAKQASELPMEIEEALVGNAAKWREKETA